MVIELYSENIIKSMKAISRREVATITDPDVRYKIEVGSEKSYEVNRSIDQAIGRLKHRLNRYLNYSFSGGTTDNLEYLPEKYSFEFVMAERRATGKHDALAAAMHDFTVEYALSKFYSDVSQVEFSNKHSQHAIAAADELESLIYTKQPPID